MEYETDTMLVSLARIQHLITRISRCTSQGKISEEMPIFAAPYVPKEVYGPAFQAEVDQFRENLPPSLQNDSKLRLSPRPSFSPFRVPPMSSTIY